MAFGLEINYRVKTPQQYEALFNKLGQRTLSVLKIKRPMSISLAFISPAEIKKVNQRYRGKNKTTDVLSFEEINEIIINYRQAAGQAKQHRHSIKQELAILFVHGLLHVLGYEDETDQGAKLMAKLGSKIIGS